MNNFFVCCIGIVSIIYGFIPTALASPWVGVACGGDVSFAKQRNGDLYGTGSVTGLGVRKQIISLSGPTNYTRFKRVLTGVIAMETSGGSSVALKKNGAVWTTGLNSFGQLGDGNVSIGRGQWRKTLAGIKAIAATPDASYALKRDGSLWVAGVGVTGDGLFKTNVSWTKSLDNVSNIWVSANYPVVKKSDGSLWRVVTGTKDRPGEWQWLPVPINGNYLVVGDNEMFVLDDIGNLRRFNVFMNEPVVQETTVEGTFQSPDNLVTDHITKVAYGIGTVYYTPGIIDSLAPAVTLAVLDKNGSLKVPSGSGYGQNIEWVTLLDNVKDFCVGETHALVLKNDGSIWATGLNNAGQYGNESTVGTNRREIWTLVAKRRK